MTISEFDLEKIRVVANGCPRHPAYRVTSSIPDYSNCKGCAAVFAATAMLCVSCVLSFKSILQAQRERSAKQ